MIGFIEVTLQDGRVSRVAVAHIVALTPTTLRQPERWERGDDGYPRLIDASEQDMTAIALANGGMLYAVEAVGQIVGRINATANRPGQFNQFN